MRYPIYTLSDKNNDFFYAEYPNDIQKGAFLKVTENDSSISIKVDRFSMIPFYYVVHGGRLYGSTKLHLLLKSLPDTFERRLNVQAAIEFLRTNSMIGSKTLLRGIDRIPFGHELVFDKKIQKSKLQQYWKLPGSVRSFSEKNLIGLLHDSFLQAILDSTGSSNKVGIHLSGGMDSRQIFGAFLREKIDFQAFTYGVPENIDVLIAGKLARKFNIDHHYYKWDGVKMFKENADLHFELTDGMQALIHGHGIEIHEDESQRVDSIIYGHFLDFFIQAHIFNPFFEEDHGFPTTQRLYEIFDGGPCSIMRGDSIEPLMFRKEYQGVFRESIYSEIKTLDYMEPQKRYDALYLIHHGLRRLMPQVQSGAQYLDFRLPGLHRDYFELAWSVPGMLRKDRMLQKKLLCSLDSRMMNIPVVKDNVRIEYMGDNPFWRFRSRLDLFLRRPGIGILPPYYNFYERELLKMANLHLYEWIRKEVLETHIEQFDFIKNDYIEFLFKDDHFNPVFSIGQYSVLLTLSKFIKKYINQEPSY